MATYEVTSLEYCTPGMERLRNRDEFILIAYPSPRAGWPQLIAQWCDDLQTCEREDGFDYAAARAAIRAAFKGRKGRNPLRAERASYDYEPTPALLYVRTLA